MTGAATAVAVVPAPAPIEVLGPPGEAPPDGFGDVLEAEARRACGEHTEAGRDARTAQAEGAAPEADSLGAADDEALYATSPTLSDGQQAKAQEPAPIASTEMTSGDAESASVSPSPDTDGLHGETAGVRTTTVIEGGQGAIPSPSPTPVPAGGAAAQSVAVAPASVPASAAGEPPVAPGAPLTPMPVGTPAETVPPVPPAETPPVGARPASPTDADPAAATRPGAVPDHGRGATERRSDPPAVGWHAHNDPSTSAGTGTHGEGTSAERPPVRSGPASPSPASTRDTDGAAPSTNPLAVTDRPAPGVSTAATEAQRERDASPAELVARACRNCAHGHPCRGLRRPDDRSHHTPPGRAWWGGDPASLRGGRRGGGGDRGVGAGCAGAGAGCFGPSQVAGGARHSGRAARRATRGTEHVGPQARARRTRRRCGSSHGRRLTR